MCTFVTAGLSLTCSGSLLQPIYIGIPSTRQTGSRKTEFGPEYASRSLRPCMQRLIWRLCLLVPRDSLIPVHRTLTEVAQSPLDRISCSISFDPSTDDPGARGFMIAHIPSFRQTSMWAAPSSDSTYPPGFVESQCHSVDTKATHSLRKEALLAGLNGPMGPLLDLSDPD